MIRLYMLAKIIFLYFEVGQRFSISLVTSGTTTNLISTRSCNTPLLSMTQQSLTWSCATTFLNYQVSSYILASQLELGIRTQSSFIRVYIRVQSILASLSSVQVWKFNFFEFKFGKNIKFFEFEFRLTTISLYIVHRFFIYSVHL